MQLACLMYLIYWIMHSFLFSLEGLGQKRPSFEDSLLFESILNFNHFYAPGQTPSYAEFP
jgi:hypothetical protein